ncbi:MAG: NfeD family protein [Prevotella sp.]|nr:NfeD family protein [Prevotella sp.]MDE7455314.1 NfeD family protein [Prevotella sp.]
MIEYFLANTWQVWAIIAVLCLIMELTSGDFFIICLSIGALGAAVVASLLGNSFYLQLLSFIIVSLVALLYVRPAAKRWLHKGEDKRVSNADALLGRTGRVTEDIKAGNNGYVQIDGDQWRAVSSQDIAAGTTVRVVDRNSTIITVETL